MDGDAAAKKATPLDGLVGERVRQQRTTLGMSQVALGEKLGVTFQQVQKYENGSNRIGASRLHAIALALGVPVSFFFEDADSPPAPDQVADIGPLTPEGIRLNRAFRRIDDRRLRRHVLDLVQSIAESGSGGHIAPMPQRQRVRTKPK